MYQCYYYKTYSKQKYLGEKILTEKFEKEIDSGTDKTIEDFDIVIQEVDD